MHSIRGKFLQLNLISILLCVVLIGGLGLWSISHIQQESSQEILNLTCRVEGQKLNEVIGNIQANVNLFCEMIDAQVITPDALQDPQFTEQLCAEAERSMGKIAGVTRGVCAYYFRLAIAKGLAVFSPVDSSPDDVFNRADKAMYADKRRMKGLD